MYNMIYDDVGLGLATVVLAECWFLHSLWRCSVGLCITNIYTLMQPRKPTSLRTNVASESHWEWEWEHKFLELSFSRAKVPGNDSSREEKVPWHGTFAPRNCRERNFLGAKVPVTASQLGVG